MVVSVPSGAIDARLREPPANAAPPSSHQPRPGSRDRPPADESAAVQAIR
jgi:hypothetical protein